MKVKGVGCRVQGLGFRPAADGVDDGKPGHQMRLVDLVVVSFSEGILINPHQHVIQHHAGRPVGGVGDCGSGIGV